MTLEVHATPQEVMRAVEALRQFGNAKGLQERALFELELALEECGTNIVSHSLRLNPTLTFQVSFEHTGDAVVIELRDRGPEFDPTQKPVIQREADLEDRQPGGWGLFLVGRIMDQLHYTRRAGENILTLTKRLDGPAEQA